MYNFDQPKQSYSIDDAINKKMYEPEESYILRKDLVSGLNRPTKRRRTEALVPILFGRLNTREKGKPKPKTIRILVDSGGSACIGKRSLFSKLKTTKDSETTWETASGDFSTKETVQAQFTLPELHEERLIEWKVHLTDNESMNYDLIIGRDLMTELGLDVLFSSNKIMWEHKTVPFKHYSATEKIDFFLSDPSKVADATDRIKRILDAKYEAADLDQVVASCTELSSHKQSMLMDVLMRHKNLFDGTLGRYKGSKYNIELQDDAKPYHAKPFPVPKVHEATLKLEIERLCKIGVLKRVNNSQWGAPSFLIPKKDGTVRFINDFRELNKQIKRKPYPIPKIQEMLLKLEGFRYATSLDLNMGYYHIELTPESKQLCTLVFPFGKYEMQRLPMGLANSPDIFQEKMSELFDGFEDVRAYIDDILLLTKGSWEDHCERLDAVLTKLENAGLKVNATKSFFGRLQLEYLGYWITREGIQPLPNKVEAMQRIAEPTNKKELRRFIGMVNYYRDMWIRRSHVLAPLTKMTSKEAKFQWTDTERKAFTTMKQILSKETLLAYPNFNKPFEIHTDASHSQLGAVISQDGKPIAFYSRKLAPAQTRYTTSERELLAIVEVLKEFRTILLGQQIVVYTDHKNLTFKKFNTERVMRWRLILEEFSPTLEYIKGSRNVVADALSRLKLTDETFHVHQYPESFGMDDKELSPHIYPLRFRTLSKAQREDPALLKKAETKDNYSMKSFRGGNKSYDLITRDGKIVVPLPLQQQITQWYHLTLCHPGETRTLQTIAQHFYWNGMRETVRKVCQPCKTCQFTKRTNKRYGHLPAKEAESVPWERLCVDLVGPYTLTDAKHKEHRMWCVTMIDPATNWFEMKNIKSKDAPTVANVVEQTWLTRYPWPSIIQYDRGSEFLAEFAEMVEDDYGIKRKPSTVRNPQSNAMIERIHQTIGNIIRSYEVSEIDLDEEDPFAGILAATMFATCASVHTTLQAPPMQLVLGRDAILNTRSKTNWKYVKDREQRLIDQNNARKNAKRILHIYLEGNRVIYRVPVDCKFGGSKWRGPFSLLNVYNNGTVRLQRGAETETVNIRNIKPYFV